MRLPLVSYTTIIDMALVVIPITNKTVHIQDQLTANDAYTCDLNFSIPTSEATAFATLIESTNRGVAISLATLLGGAYPNFHPFGPHVDLTGGDNVKIIDYEDQGKADYLGTYWNFKLTIVPAETLVLYTATTDCGAGGFRFGTLTNFYLPEIKPSIEFKVYNTRFGSGTFLYHNNEDTQHKRASLQWENIETEGARNILIELVKNVRSIPVTMNAGTNQWPFSLREGQGDKTVRLSNSKVEITNDVANMWSVGFEVIDVN